MQIRLNPIMLTFSVIILFSISASKNKNDTTESPPNIIIIYTDDQGTLDAGCYGANDLYTPNIDRLSRSGIRFTQAYAHTVCCSSRAAMLTGRHPQRSGITNWTQNDAHAKEKGINMPLSEVTIAEVKTLKSTPIKKHESVQIIHYSFSTNTDSP